MRVSEMAAEYTQALVENAGEYRLSADEQEITSVRTGERAYQIVDGGRGLRYYEGERHWVAQLGKRNMRKVVAAIRAATPAPSEATEPEVNVAQLMRDMEALEAHDLYLWYDVIGRVYAGCAGECQQALEFDLVCSEELWPESVGRLAELAQLARTAVVRHVH